MSLKEIAKMAGVSVSTVSRVLNNKDYNCASEEVKDKIWEAAQKIHYVPDENARNLKKGHMTQKNIHKRKLTVILGRYESIEQDPFFSELFRYVNQEIFANGCVIGNMITAKEMLEQGMPKSDGYIILGRSSEHLLKELKKRSRNIVAVDRNPTSFEIDEVVCDGREAAIKAMEYLLGKGHKNIAYIGDCSYETRFVGYCNALMQRKLPLDYSYIYATQQTKQGGYEAMKKLLQTTDVAAVLCANDATALGALLAYSENGSHGIDIISIDDIREASETIPALTTMHVPAQDMGRMAVRILLDRMDKGHTEVMRIEFPSRLVRRESC